MKNKIKYKFAIIGGDKRQAVIACELIKCGHSVSCFALDECVASISDCEICSTLEKAMEGALVAILPLPVTRDNFHLSVAAQKIEFYEIVRLAKKNSTLLLGGLIPQELVRVCAEAGVEIVDYYKSEKLQLKNALPSAEGALMTAMEHTDITVWGMRAIVVGYGRIGKILTNILLRLGADVTVAARRDETLCEISMSGIKAARTDTDNLSKISDCDVIFNTVPSVIFNESVLKNLKKFPLYIEIASAPGGIDVKAARNMGIEIINVPSLPGKYSPVSAGKYVFETVQEILSERRIDI